MRIFPSLSLRVIAVVFAFSVFFCPATPARASEADEPAHRIPGGVYIELTRDFYEALKEGNSGTGDKIYADTPSQDYLRRIAVASEFAVKTNLEILKQQDEMLRILNRIAEQQQKACREPVQVSVPRSDE